MVKKLLRIMTMDIYSHVLPDMQQEAMGKMHDLFGRDVLDDGQSGDMKEQQGSK